MRCLAVSLGLVFCLLLLTGCPKPPPKIVGKWASTQPTAGVFEFSPDGGFVGTPPNGRVERGTYSVDTSKSPAWIDLTPLDGQPRALGIMMFRSDDEVEMSVGFPGDPRPTAFGQAHYYVMRRLAN